MSITDFLNARIAEDEAVARGILGAPSAAESIIFAQRMLAECAAKRAIVEECLNVQANPWDYADAIYTAEVAVYALAAVYADHPAYLDKWRVGA